MKKFLFICIFILLLLSCSGVKYPVTYSVSGGSVLEVSYIMSNGDIVDSTVQSPWEVKFLFNIGDNIGFSVNGGGEEITATIEHNGIIDSKQSTDYILFYGYLF